VWKLSQRDDAQTAARSAAAGELGLSVGFQPIHSQIHKRAARWAPELGPDHKDWISRTESRLIEVSLTPIPVYDEAQVVLVRSAYVHDVDAPPPPTPMLDGWRAEAQRLRSGEH
jgi:phage head maturation protease